MPAFAGMTIGGFRGERWLLRRTAFAMPRRAAPLQAVIPANAGIQRLQSRASIKPWMPAFAGMTIGGFRGKRRLLPRTAFAMLRRAAPLQAVIPANAGIQRLQSRALMEPWMPAFAGRTIGGFPGASHKSSSPRKRGSRAFSATAARKPPHAKLSPARLPPRPRSTEAANANIPQCRAPRDAGDLLISPQACAANSAMRWAMRRRASSELLRARCQAWRAAPCACSQLNAEPRRMRW